MFFFFLRKLPQVIYRHIKQKNSLQSTPNVIKTHFINWPFTSECLFYKLWFRLQVEQVRYPRVEGPITYTNANKTKGFLELCHRIY